MNSPWRWLIGIGLCIALLFVLMHSRGTRINRLLEESASWPMVETTVVRSEISQILFHSQHGPATTHLTISLGIDLDQDGNEDINLFDTVVSVPGDTNYTELLAVGTKLSARVDRATSRVLIRQPLMLYSE